MQKIVILNYKNLGDDDVISLLRFSIKEKQVTIIPTVILKVYMQNECKSKCQKLLESNGINVLNEVLEYNDEKFYRWTMHELSNELIRKYTKGVLKFYCYGCEESYSNIITGDESPNMVFENAELFSFDKILRELAENDKKNVVKYYLKLMDGKEKNIGISLHEIIRICKENKMSNEIVCNVVADTIWNLEEFKATYEIKTSQFLNDSYIDGYLRPGSRANVLKFEMNNIEYSAFFFNFLTTGNYKYFDTIDYMYYLNDCFDTDRFSSFLNELNYSKLFYEMNSIYPKELGKDDFSFEQLSKYVNKYNSK